eukprot:3688932-Rhodomonas_salina.5
MDLPVFTNDCSSRAVLQQCFLLWRETHRESVRDRTHSLKGPSQGARVATVVTERFRGKSLRGPVCEVDRGARRGTGGLGSAEQRRLSPGASILRRCSAGSGQVCFRLQVGWLRHRVKKGLDWCSSSLLLLDTQ